MRAAELDEVEGALGRPLPADFRHFSLTCSDQDWRRYCAHFYQSPKQMVRENQAHPRRSPDSNVCEPDGTGGFRERPWPADWTIVGDGDSEWYNFVRPDAPGVWEWQHDTQAVSQVAASFGEYLERRRELIGPPPVLEVIRHPALGELCWNPERRTWTARIAGVDVVLKPRDGESEAFLVATAELVTAAVAAEPRVFADAMAAGGWAEFLEWADGVAHGLTADSVRGHLVWESLEVTPGPKVEYHYRTTAQVGHDFLWAWVKTSAALSVTEQGWFR